MTDKISQLSLLLKKQLKLALSISFGVFLFVIFYKPFIIEKFDDIDWLIFVAGLSAIVFILIFLVRVAFPWFTQSNEDEQKPAFVYTIGGSILFVLNSTAFIFYLHYVGSLEVSTDLLLNTTFICITPPIILWLSDRFRRLGSQNEILINEKAVLQKQIDKYETDYQNTTVEFISESQNEIIELSISNVLMVQSADNYVEIIYTENNVIKKKLLRNTLKNIEDQLKPFSCFIRCHRICIVNTFFVEKLNRDETRHWLSIKGFDEEIPVSRQYLIKLKESI